MSVYYGVQLRRIARVCPSCHAPRTVRTNTAGTRIFPSCNPLRCRIARTIALAGGAREPWFEPLPVDDRHVNRRQLLGGVA